MVAERDVGEAASSRCVAETGLATVADGVRAGDADYERGDGDDQ